MRKKRFALLVGILAVTLLLTACAGVNLTLTFEVDGEAYATVTTSGQEAVQMPKDPVKEGYVFDGWYWDKDVWEKPFTVNSLLETPLTENMTVYAKWKKEAEEHVHSFGEWTVVTAASCTAEGLEKRVCECGEEETRPIEKLPHTYEAKHDTENHWKECVVCHEEIDKTAHFFDNWTVVTPATCTAEGTEKSVCECGTEKTRAIEKLPHAYQWETDGTRLSGKCEICDEEETREDTSTYALSGTEYYVNGVKEGTIPTEVIIPAKNNGKSITSIGNQAFKGCNNLRSVEIPDSVTSIGEGAFEGCSSLKSVEIPDSVTSIGFGAFRDCSSLKSVVIPDSVTSIDFAAFRDCSSLESVVIGSGVASISNGVFNGTRIWNNAADNSVVYVDKWAVDYKGERSTVTNITLRADTVGIGSYALRGCSSLVSIVIPDSVTSIGSYVFEGTGIWNNAADNSVVYADKWAVGYKGKITNVILRADTVGISNQAFWRCSSLDSIAIPDSVTSIGSYTFQYCYGLDSVVIGNGVTSIGYQTFRECSSLDSVVIGNGVTSIGYGAFLGCHSLKSIVIPDSVMSIDDYAFAGCGSFMSIVIPDSVTSIGNGAFNECINLRNVVIGNGVTSIGYGAFAGTYLLRYATNNSVVYADKWAVGYKGKITNATLRADTAGIGERAFRDCSSLKSVEIPDSVTSIGSQAFDGCSSLVSVVIPNSVTSIENSAFYYCRNLEIIEYGGTKAEWYAITKGDFWSFHTGNYTVTCTDGTLSKEESKLQTEKFA